MRKTTQGNIQKNITLTPELFYALLDRAKETKLDFQDYVRVLLAASIKSDLPPDPPALTTENVISLSDRFVQSKNNVE